MIYTSGSTGQPKGVMVEHHSVINLAQAQIKQFHVTTRSHVVQFASLAFDASLWEIIMALCSGASLYIPNQIQRQDAASLQSFLLQHAISHATLPPALLQTQSLDFTKLNTLSTLIMAGEAPHPSLIRSLSALPHVVNAYGPTEGTVCASAWYCPGNFDGEVVPIGRPIANTQIYILNAHGQPAPIGVTGEIHIAGAGAARGYLNRPELTAERFLSDPFSKEPNARMYKTGDLGR